MLTKNRLIEMLGSLKLVEKEIKTLKQIANDGHLMNPSTIDKLEIGLNYMEHQVNFLKACVLSETDKI